VALTTERECEQSVVTLFVQQTLTRGAYLAVEFTRIVASNNSSEIDSVKDDPRADIGSVLFAVDF